LVTFTIHNDEPIGYLITAVSHWKFFASAQSSGYPYQNIQLPIYVAPKSKHRFLTRFIPSNSYIPGNDSGDMRLNFIVHPIGSSVTVSLTVQQSFSGFAKKYISLQNPCVVDNTVANYYRATGSTPDLLHCVCKEEFYGPNCQYSSSIDFTTHLENNYAAFIPDSITYSTSQPETYHWGQSFVSSLTNYNQPDMIDSIMHLKLIIGPNYSSDPGHIRPLLNSQFITTELSHMSSNLSMPQPTADGEKIEMWHHPYLQFTFQFADSRSSTHYVRLNTKFLTECRWLETARNQGTEPFCNYKHTATCNPKASQLNQVCTCKARPSPSLAFNPTVNGLQQQDLHFGAKCDGVVSIYASKYLYPGQNVKVDIKPDLNGAVPTKIALYNKSTSQEVVSVTSTDRYITIPNTLLNSGSIMKRALPFTTSSSTPHEFEFRVTAPASPSGSITTPLTYTVADPCYYMSLVNHPSPCSYNINTSTTTTTTPDPTSQCKPHDPNGEFCVCNQNAGFFNTPQCRLSLTIVDQPQQDQDRYVYPINGKIKVKYNYYWINHESYDFSPNQKLQIITQNGGHHPYPHRLDIFKLSPSDYVENIVGELNPWLDSIQKGFVWGQNNNIEGMFELNLPVGGLSNNSGEESIGLQFYIIEPEPNANGGNSNTRLYPLSFKFTQSTTSQGAIILPTSPQSTIYVKNPCQMLVAQNGPKILQCQSLNPMTDPKHMFNSKSLCDPMNKRCSCADWFYGDQCQYLLHPFSDKFAVASHLSTTLPPGLRISTLSSRSTSSTSNLISFSVKESLKREYTVNAQSIEEEEHKEEEEAAKLDENGPQFETTQLLSTGPFTTLSSSSNINNFEIQLTDSSTTTPLTYSITQPFQILSNCPVCIEANTERCNELYINNNGEVPQCVCKQDYWGEKCENKLSFNSVTAVRPEVDDPDPAWDAAPENRIYSYWINNDSSNDFQLQFDMMQFDTITPEGPFPNAYSVIDFVIIEEHTQIGEILAYDETHSFYSVGTSDFPQEPSSSISEPTNSQPYTTYKLVLQWTTSSSGLTGYSSPIATFRK
jgi:hypothetical protein